MRANIKVETIWLRSWTTPLMPPTVLKLLGLPIPESLKDAKADDHDFKSDQGDSSASFENSAAPPSPRRPRGGG